MKGRGYDIQCLDFKNFKIGERYNPISFLEQDLDITKFASMIFHNRSFQGDPFWDDMAKSLFNDLYPISERTIPKV